MGIPIPEMDVKFARMAAQLGLVTADRIRESLELYRKYQAAGGEVPSIPRIMVAKGYIPRDKAVEILRRIEQGSGTMVSVPTASAPVGGGAVPDARLAATPQAQPAMPVHAVPLPSPYAGSGSPPGAGALPASPIHVPPPAQPSSPAAVPPYGPASVPVSRPVAQPANASPVSQSAPVVPLSLIH
ncbi:MAG: hypothetical protein N3A38_15305, partial [Planctomycetota bacterium]|nr:hypothetical protein [Planctomycetota bacterium]